MSRKEEVEHWYITNAEKIKKWANKRSIQDAEDILQDTAVRLLTEKTNWEAITQRNITRWTMYDYYKNLIDFEEYDTAMSSESCNEEITNSLYTTKCITVINECVETLGGASKEIFKMHFFQDMGYEEISVKLGVPYGSCKQLGSRARKIVVNKFKEILND